MTFKEKKVRFNWFIATLRMYIHDLLTYKESKGYGVKRTLSWDLTCDDKVVEHYEGTLWDYVKWLLTYETFDNL